MVSLAKTRILIANTHRLVREGLRMMLGQETSIQIVGDAANGMQMFSAIGELKPDVVLLDMNMPDMDTGHTLSLLKSKGTKPLVLTTWANEETILGALRAGAKGYLPESTTAQNLIKAIESVSKGEIWVERKMVNTIVEGELNSDHPIKEQRNQTKEQLTHRETEVLLLRKEGYTNKEIAEQLHISKKTVKSHLNNIFRRFNVSGRLQAIVYAIRNGLC
jgi:DNA-binding NarL/FixJ family response regulator